MARSLDVLLIDAQPDAGLRSAAQLAAAGCRVHRCYPRVSAGGARACVAVTDGTCPIDDGGVDVAVVAGPVPDDSAAAAPAGVTCALRRHVPLVADDTCSASFGSRLAARANGDIVAACQRAAGEAFADLRRDIFRRLRPALDAEGLGPDDLACWFRLDGPRLTITLEGPPATLGLQQTLAVRALDAVRASGRTFRQVDVEYEDTAA
jgi:hypothetical protein